MYELWLDGPGKNSLGDAMMTHIFDGLREANGRPILFLGKGDAFSSGLHLREVADLDEASGRRFLSRLEELMSEIFQYPAPTVACVNGHAIAGGCIVAMCCDWRVGPKGGRTKIGLNEVAIGLRFPPRIFEICKRRLSVRYHTEVLLGARLYGPEDALAVGLLDELSSTPESTARERLASFAAYPPEAYAAAKRDLRGETHSDLVDNATWSLKMLELMPVWTDPALKGRIGAVLSAKR